MGEAWRGGESALAVLLPQKLEMTAANRWLVLSLSRRRRRRRRWLGVCVGLGFVNRGCEEEERSGLALWIRTRLGKHERRVGSGTRTRFGPKVQSITGPKYRPITCYGLSISYIQAHYILWTVSISYIQAHYMSWTVSISFFLFFDFEECFICIVLSDQIQFK